jgi:cytosine/uracil/thiamine/allantoin permease
MDDVTKHQLYIAPSIGKLHVMIQLLINHCITREFFSHKILTLNFILFSVISFFFSKESSHILEEMFWEKDSPSLDTKFRFWAVFFVNFHIFLQTFCQLIINLCVDAMSKK